VAACHFLPDHLSAVLVGTSARVGAPVVVLQQSVDLPGEGLRVVERNELPSTICQHFLGVPVGSGDHGGPCPHCIGQRPGDDLFACQIRCAVDIGGAKISAQHVEGDKPAMEQHVILNAETVDHHLEDVTIFVATGVPYDIRVRGTEDQVDGVGIVFYDCRHRFEHHLDALARPQKAEG